MSDGRPTFCTRSQGAQDRVAVHGTEARRRWWRARLPQLDISAIKGVKCSAREPSAAGAGRVSTVSVLHGVPHRGYLWDEVAQRVDDELIMGY
jgi:hypothetical protein